MTAQDRRRAQRRGKSLECAAARALGSTRTARIGSRRREPDVAPVTLPDGTRLIAEAKARRRLPRLLVDGLAQAQGYDRHAAPVLVVRELGGRALVAMELEVWCRVVGLEAAALPTRHRPTRRRKSAAQLELEGIEIT